MKNKILLFCFLIISLGLVLINACSKSSRREVAILETDLGRISIGFFPQDAPRHVLRFKELAKSGFYDGLLFHRIIPGFVIQTGDPLTRDPSVPRSRYGSGGSGKTLKAEFNQRIHKRGIVGMSRNADPESDDSVFYDTADSQFYICVDESPHLNGKYTAIGEVLDGMEVADLIADLDRDALNIPVKPIALQSVIFISYKEFEKQIRVK